LPGLAGDLNAVLMFVAVVDAGSFTGAAKRLGIAKSRVSRKVAELEARLGVRLLHRTTRSSRLTDLGRDYYERAKPIIEALEAAERVITEGQAEPQGELRVAIPLGFGFLGSAFARFAQQYPRVRLRVHCSDQLFDLIAGGFHVAIRAGDLADSSLVGRRLGTAPRVLVASSAYLEQQPAPATPDALSGHACLLFSAGHAPQTWRLTRDARSVDVQVSGALIANDYDLLREAALAGLGIVSLPVFRCADHIRLGQLQRVLGDWHTEDIPIHAVYPSTRQLVPKVRAFVDTLVTHFSPPPWASC
jgi:DNA-binding transcriptional LysR family regulator